MIAPGTSLRELAFLVATALRDAGETAVLTGGGAATIYSEAAYQSRDLDFVWTMRSALGRVPAAPILALGFRPDRGGYAHPDSPYTLEFPPGPLAIGDELVTAWEVLEDGAGRVLPILSPTDSVRDRLAHLIHYRDFRGLEQALLVARGQTVDLARIEAWCRREGGDREWETFRSRLG